jgi:hypothetical protein
MSLTYDTSSVNYDRNVFIIQATDALQVLPFRVGSWPGGHCSCSDERNTILTSAAFKKYSKSIKTLFAFFPWKAENFFSLSLFSSTTCSFRQQVGRMESYEAIKERKHTLL